MLSGGGVSLMTSVEMLSVAIVNNSCQCLLQLALRDTSKQSFGY